jgi:hypothetical protein
LAHDSKWDLPESQPKAESTAGDHGPQASLKVICMYSGVNS